MERTKDVSTLRKIDEHGMTRDQLSEKIDAALRDAKSSLPHEDIASLKRGKLLVKDEIMRLREESKTTSH